MHPPPKLSQMAYYSVEKKIYPTYSSHTTLRGGRGFPLSLEHRGTELTNFMKKWKFVIFCTLMRLFEYIPVQKELFAYVLCFRSYLCVKFVNKQTFWAYKGAGLLVHSLNNVLTVGPTHTKVV